VSSCYDATIIGSGPNGLAAGITLPRAGLAVLLLEAQETLGGGLRSAELSQPAFVHDVCSAVHPLAIASPFFCTLLLAEHGLDWVHSPVPSAHPLDGGTAVLLERDVEATSMRLDIDSKAYSKLMAPLVRDWYQLRFHIETTWGWPKALSESSKQIHFRCRLGSKFRAAGRHSDSSSCSASRKRPTSKSRGLKHPSIPMSVSNSSVRAFLHSGVKP
jgi:phytoene dehydrogenase-like protein